MNTITENKNESQRQINPNDQCADKDFSIRIGNERFEFYTIKIFDPVPTARQIIESGDSRPVDEYLIFEVLRGGHLRELKLDQTVDLRNSEEKSFLIFKSDRSWRGVIDGKRFEWGAQDITGRALKCLANVNPDEYSVWLERTEEADMLIGDDETVSLDPSGVERFRTGEAFKIYIDIEGKDILWNSKTITPKQIAELGGWDVSNGVIEVDSEQNERTLQPDEVVEIRSDVSYGKKLRFKRGLT